MNSESGFSSELLKVLKKNSFNNYSDNWDEYRFGIEPVADFKSRIKKKLGDFVRFLNYTLRRNISQGVRFRYLYQLLEEKTDRELLIDLVALRILGYKRMKLGLNTAAYWKGIRDQERLVDKSNYVSVKFNDLKLALVSIRNNGNIQFYYSAYGVFIDFILEQYQYKVGSKIIRTMPGDYVIDAGGCWGDTAIYFADSVGENGRVFTYEFIPSNLEILKRNLGLNENLSARVSVVENPVWSTSDLTLRYIDNGPASKVFFDGSNDANGEVKTLSIDDLVNRKRIQKIDFIKMDIEGAEMHALRGAVDTIKKFKPKLAIAIYHDVNDFTDIPKFIDELNLGYKFYLGHYTIHLEETILFAEA